jgi:hypothetical protein
MRDDVAAGDAVAFLDVGDQADDRLDLRRWNGRYPQSCPGLTISIPMLAEFTSVTPRQCERPACQARLSSGTSWWTVPSSSTK